MTARRRALSLAAICSLMAGGAAAWALAPAQVQADTPVATQPVVPDLWTKGPVDRDYMVKGILDYRSDTAKR